MPALTAYHCLFSDGPIEGKRVLVAGGAGAVGHSAIELAKWGGAEVITTVSELTEKLVPGSVILSAPSVRTCSSEVMNN